MGIGNLIFVYNSSCVVLGRAYALLAPYLLSGIADVVRTGSFARLRSWVAIVASMLGYDAPPVGAAALVIREVLRHPRQATGTLRH